MKAPVQQKPTLSFSGMRMYLRCGEQYKRRYVMGERIKPGAPMLAGTGAHASAAADLARKAATGELLDDDAVQDIARDEFEREWQRSDIELSAEEMQKGLKVVHGEFADLTVEFAKAHHSVFAPRINAIADRIEWKWRMETTAAHDLIGVIDRMESVKIVQGGKRVSVRRTRDFKTTSSARVPKPDLAAGDDQTLLYAIASEVVDGVPSPLVAVDTLRYEMDKTTKKKKVVPYVSTATRTVEDQNALWRKFEVVSDGIAKGVFVPAKRDDDWWCSAKWCGYATTCPFYAGRVTAAVPSGPK